MPLYIRTEQQVVVGGRIVLLGFVVYCILDEMETSGRIVASLSCDVFGRYRGLFLTLVSTAGPCSLR